MRLLLDTHIFLWYIAGDVRVRGDVRYAIENSEVAYVSVASRSSRGEGQHPRARDTL